MSMKTSILRTACFVFVIVLANGFVTKAQESFCNTKWENGKVVSKTKYEMGDYGMFEPKFEIKFAYDKEGNFLEKEVSVCNPKYDFNDKTGRWEPDCSEKNWTPQYRILQKKDLASNFISVELYLWNTKEKSYNAPTETMIYQTKDSNHFNYLAFTRGNKYDEVANLINYDKELLARLGK